MDGGDALTTPPHAAAHAAAHVAAHAAAHVAAHAAAHAVAAHASPHKSSPNLKARNVALKRLYRDRTAELNAALKRAGEAAALKDEVMRLRKANAALTAKCDNAALWGTPSTLHHAEVARLTAEVTRLTKQVAYGKQQHAGAAARHNSQVEEMQRRLDKATGRLEAAEKTASFYESKANQYMAEARHLRRELAVSIEARVRKEVFRAIEATGNAAFFPKSLMPTLAAMQDDVAPAALQRRERRLRDPSSHPSGFHPSVHEYSTLLGSHAFSDGEWESDCDV